MENLTPEQAFAAMFVFLEDYYQRTQADDIGAMLGSLQILSDGKPADPALWEDWLLSIHKISPRETRSRNNFANVYHELRNSGIIE